MKDITIPPEALEAAARALAIENETREDWWRFYEGKARAACNALLAAWPGALTEWNTRARGKAEEIILPLTEKGEG